MAKKILFPARVVIECNRVDGVVSIVTCNVKYNGSLDEYPEFPPARFAKIITLTPAQETQIKNFCRDVVLPQI